MALIDDFNQIKSVLTALDTLKPARFAYREEALEATGAAEITALDGVYEIDDASQINSIPDADQVAMDSLIMSIGLRTQGATISRMMINHFFGRLSLNLLKLTEKVKLLAETHLVNRYIAASGKLMEYISVAYTSTKITVTQHFSSLSADAPDTSTAAIDIDAAVYNGNAGLMTGADKKKLDDVDNNAVKVTGDQTIGGVKTFSSIPVLPAENPTTDDQAARKKYVDDQVAAADMTIFARNNIAHSVKLTSGDLTVPSNAKILIVTLVGGGGGGGGGSKTQAGGGGGGGGWCGGG